MSQRFSMFGTAPSPEDDRDHSIERYVDLKPVAALPSVVGQANIDAYPGIRNQGQEGSCTGHGFRSVKETQERRVRAPHSGRVPRFGPRGIYELGKQVGGYPDEEGAYLRDVLKAAAQYGSPYERSWPYVAGRRGKPRKSFYTDAERYQIGAYARLNTTDEALNVLEQVGPVYAASTWFREWSVVDRNGTLAHPRNDEGGHCYALIAADRDRQAFYVANSWGPEWGLDGFFWLPFAYLPDIDFEMWSIPDSPTQKN